MSKLEEEQPKTTTPLRNTLIILDEVSYRLDTLDDTDEVISVLNLLMEHYRRKKFKNSLVSVDEASLHKYQQRILELSKTMDVQKLSLRKLGEQIGTNSAQVVKYHKEQLEKLELI